ncbi:hypothetical protein BGZ83_002723 [Gryganskiella cystojenkinii]|nr:hypothetical protein BGZ83_002723 [Gryganskiella cystojenkinii]
MKITTILSALAAATLVSAGGKVHTVASGREHVPNGYIVEFDPHANHNDFQNSLKHHKIDYKVRSQYSIFNGAAITVNSEHQAEDLAKIAGVKNVWPIVLYTVPKVTQHKKSDKEPLSDHKMTGVDVLHDKYKLTGKGIKVGVIDTGIDYNHPAFAGKGQDKGCFARYGKNCRVTHGWDFVGDHYDGKTTPKSDSDPMDCYGHGTHVAGIIGGNALHIKSPAQGPAPPTAWVGVAPEVTFGAYRVFGCDGVTGSDIIMQAMELAFNDGMDIINMSLGGGSAYKTNPEAILADKLIVKGMALAAAAGNDGSAGVWMVSDAGLGDLSSSVASFDNAFQLLSSFSFAGVKHPYSPSIAYGKPIAIPAYGLQPIFEADGSLSDGCDPARYAGLDVSQKVVLVLGDVTRCKSGGRGAVAVGAKAAGMVVQTTPYGIASLGGTAGFPMAAIEFKAGNDLLAGWKKDAKQAVTWNAAAENFQVEGGGFPSSFSSFGLDGDLRSKPDIGAPGGAILSTYPLAKGSYAVLSGTSMATPYIAGSHALYMQAKHAKPHGDVIRKVFKNTATLSKDINSKSITSAAKQGSGLVNVLAAVLTTSSISPDHIDLLDTNHFQKTVKIQIKNDGKHSETYSFSHIPAGALVSYGGNNTYPFATPVVEDDYASVSFSQNKVKIPGGKSAKITLHFNEPKKGDAKNWPIYSGYVVATPATKGAFPVHVPYTGLKGDVSKIPIVDVEDHWPAFTHTNDDGSIVEYPKFDVLDFTKDTTPLLEVTAKLGSHTPNFTIRVFKGETFVGYVYGEGSGAAVGPVGRNKLVTSSGTNDVYSYPWAGRVVASAKDALNPTLLPSDTYRIEVASQYKFTEDVYPKNYEIFNLKTVTIKTA